MVTTIYKAVKILSKMWSLSVVLIFLSSYTYKKYFFVYELRYYL